MAITGASWIKTAQLKMGGFKGHRHILLRFTSSPATGTKSLTSPRFEKSIHNRAFTLYNFGLIVATINWTSWLFSQNCSAQNERLFKKGHWCLVVVEKESLTWDNKLRTRNLSGCRSSSFPYAIEAGYSSIVAAITGASWIKTAQLKMGGFKRHRHILLRFTSSPAAGATAPTSPRFKKSNQSFSKSSCHNTINQKVNWGICNQ